MARRLYTKKVQRSGPCRVRIGADALAEWRAAARPQSGERLARHRKAMPAELVADRFLALAGGA